MNPTLINQLRASFRQRGRDGVCCFHHAVYNALGWVEWVETTEDTITIHHSYPEDIDIKPHVKDIIKQFVPKHVLIELSFNRIDPSQARRYREKRDDG